jgi:hypothetical protein
MQPERELDADEAAQEVVNTWGTLGLTGNGRDLPQDFKALFDKTCAYRNAKEVADSGRAQGMLAEKHAAREQTTKKEFLDAYRALYKARQ